MAGNGKTPEDDAHIVRIITEKSLAFIDENRDRQFFLFVSHNTIHTPWLRRSL